jgi:S-adenosylmethionine decarboxylase
LSVLLSPRETEGKRLSVLDAGVADPRVLTDPRALLEAALRAVDAGGGHILDRALAVFPNGAVTLVLVLAESHLSIHTWPEETLVAIDLFSCGAIDGARVLSSLTADLGLGDAIVRHVPRGTGAGRAG